MAKSGNSKDKVKSEITVEEIERFKKLTEGHMRLLEAIGNL
jgi:hypothetical protein